jgi:hypothetical protein
MLYYISSSKVNTDIIVLKIVSLNLLSHHFLQD